jgi:uncharacterized protein
VVRFWDTSALIPLFIEEKGTAQAKSWLRTDPTVVVWTLTRVELLSALARRRREEPVASKRLQTARQEVLNTWTRWSEVTAVDVVRRYAERLVETYPLRAADALQLGAALVVAENGSAALTFVTFDRRQAEAAEHEGFRVLGP